MLAKKCTINDLQTALEKVNQQYDNNIKFRRLDQQGRGVRFTLTVNSSRGKGARLSVDYANRRRHLAAACWHVHGNFFDCLFGIVPEAEITSNGEKITKDYGNWRDWNIGSMMYPMAYSYACECEL